MEPKKKAQEALIDIETYFVHTQKSDRNTKLELILYNTKDPRIKIETKICLYTQIK